MKDPAASNEQPPYLDKCKEKSVEELHEFIEDSLEKRLDPGLGAEIPRSEEEFRSLWAMLREKARTLIVPYVPRSYEPSEELTRLREKRRRTSGFLTEAPKKNTSQTRRRVRELEREIADLQARDMVDHSNRRSAYLSSEPHNDKLSKIITKVRKDIDRAFVPWADVPTEDVRWEYFPTGEYSSVNDVFRHYEGLRHRNPRIRYDQDRIKKAESLGPNKRWVEKGGVKDYMVLTFDHTPKALMESPIYGNAAYVLSDWKQQSRMSKRELIDMADQSDEVIRVTHQGDWSQDIKQALEFDAPPPS